MGPFHLGLQVVWQRTLLANLGHLGIWACFNDFNLLTTLQIDFNRVLSVEYHFHQAFFNVLFLGIFSSMLCISISCIYIIYYIYICMWMLCNSIHFYTPEFKSNQNCFSSWKVVLEFSISLCINFKVVFCYEHVNFVIFHSRIWNL